MIRKAASLSTYRSNIENTTGAERANRWRAGRKTCPDTFAQSAESASPCGLNSASLSGPQASSGGVRRRFSGPLEPCGKRKACSQFTLEPCVRFRRRGTAKASARGPRWTQLRQRYGLSLKVDLAPILPPKGGKPQGGDSSAGGIWWLRRKSWLRRTLA